MNPGYLEDSPDSILKRVQQMEDADLPSLPSFQHDDSEDGEFETGSESSLEVPVKSWPNTQRIAGTPHPLRKSFRPSSASPLTGETSSDMSSNSPFPPLLQEDQQPSPYYPSTARTSTPQLQSSFSRTDGSVTDSRSGFVSHRRTDSGSTGLSTSVKSARWQPPREMSASFSGEEIHRETPYSVHVGVPPQDDSKSDDVRTGTTHPSSAQTPLTRRLSAGNVVITRPGRRSVSDTLQCLPPVKEIQALSPIESESVPACTESGPSSPTPHLIQSQNRLPSLSHSEVSASEPSEAASTPEGPTRVTDVPGSVAEGRILFDWQRLGDSQYYESEGTGAASDADEMELPSLGTMLGMAEESAVAIKAIDGPARSTSGEFCLNDQQSGSNDLMATPRARTVLSDVTRDQNASHHPLLTPSPFTQESKDGESTVIRGTPGAAERRKSHVLAVLSSESIAPRRIARFPRGTPHPLRHVSAPSASSLSATHSPETHHNWSHDGDIGPLTTPQYTSNGTVDESFVSVASSADLTSDRRSTSHRQAFSRGNTSFPTILLPTLNNTSSPGVMSRGAYGEQRADGAKIHKHLNAMNKQLLEANEELAREAEGWRQKSERLADFLRKAGFTEVDLTPAHLNVSMESAQHSDRSVERETSVASGMDSGQDSRDPSSQNLDQLNFEQQAILEEMADKLEMLERGLEEKNRLIADLEAGDIEELKTLLAEGEAARAAMQQDFASRTEEHARQFSQISDDYEKQLALLRSRLAEADMRIEELDKQLAEKGDLNDASTQRLAEVGTDVKGLTLRLEEALMQNDKLSAELRGLQDRAGPSEQSLQDLQSSEPREESGSPESEWGANGQALERTQALQARISGLQEELKEREAMLSNLAAELEQTRNQFGRDMELLRSARQGSDDEIKRLRSELAQNIDDLARKEAELEAARAPKEVGDETPIARQLVGTMEGHLEEAFREIGRLKHQLAATPHLEATLATRNAQVEALEREKAALQARIAAPPSMTSGLHAAASPFKATPFVHRAIASLRAPRTPGSLPEISWLQNSITDANEPMLRAQIEHLQDQLDDANDQLDANFSRLESAGLSGVHQAENLARARARIVELEHQIRDLMRRNTIDREHQGQHGKPEAEDAAQSDDALRSLLNEMESLRSDFTAERERLQGRCKRLTGMISELRHDHSIDLQAVRSECDKELSIKDSDVRKSKAEVVAVRRLAEQAQAVCYHLRQEMDQADDEEAQSAERKLRSLEGSLRAAESELSTLKRIAEASNREATAEVDSLQRRMQAALEEGEKHLRLLRACEGDLTASRQKVAEMTRERRRVAQQLAEIEEDLSQHQRDSQRFGAELKKLKDGQNDRTILHAKELQAAKNEAAAVGRRMAKIQEDLEAKERENRDLQIQLQIATANPPSAGLDDLRSKYKLQMHDLATQICYLKAKYTREASFRNALALQKRYLLLLVGGMSLSEQAALKLIASMGVPSPAPQRPKRNLKTVTMAIISTIRARNMAREWRSDKDTKMHAIAAREERKRQAT